MVERARVATGQAASVRCACHSQRTQLARMARSVDTLDTLLVDGLRWWPLDGLGDMSGARDTRARETHDTDEPKHLWKASLLYHIATPMDGRF